MPGILPLLPSYTRYTETWRTAHHATATPTPTHAVVEGILAAAPTYPDAVWYRQPWTVPAAGLLCIYSICSIIMLALLLHMGKLDLKLNASGDAM